MFQSSRMKREEKTVAAMIALYCQSHHHHGHGLCASCDELQDYARERLGKCPYQEGKTICSKCKVHCYKPEMREKIREIMRYSGPRMMYRHPIMAISHLVDRMRKEPAQKNPGNS
ncbi:MAG: hypothetical protein A2Z74_01510 [Chloroflexi bacterium RBG_13_46_9]|nr:MAG: hypothetical protein A2Z74_01510 [Chloroflexi bacterium RBG_13_46_9]